MSEAGDTVRTAITWSNVRVRLGDLQPWTQNPRHITRKQAERLAESFEDFGQVEPIAVGPRGDGGYPVYNGHQRLSVLLKLHGAGYEIDARQSSRPLTDDERRKLVVFLHAGAVGGWDWDKVSAWSAPDLMQWGFDADTLQAWRGDIAALGILIESETPEPQDAEPQFDRAAELQEKWQVKTGDLWRIGEHRLLCGDSTKREDVERVTQGKRSEFSFTDPPYNVGVAIGDATNDARSKSDFIAWCKLWTEHLPKRVCLTVGIKRLLWWDEILGDPQWIIAWVKRNGQGQTGFGGTNKWDAILCYGIKPDYKTDLIELNNDYSESIKSDGGHPTAKPVELWSQLIDRFSDVGSVVFEPFVGTGTALIACENTKRIGRGIEIEPKYCALTIERMATAFPGIEIERIE